MLLVVNRFVPFEYPRVTLRQRAFGGIKSALIDVKTLKSSLHLAAPSGLEILQVVQSSQCLGKVDQAKFMSEALAQKGGDEARRE